MKKGSVTILGGGISGLTAAYLLARKGVKVRVIEGAPEFGGLLRTFDVGGTRLEHFYHHFFTHDAEITWLLQELGLSEKITYRKTTMGVFRHGKIFDFNGPADLFRFTPINALGKIRFALTSLFLGKFANWREGENTAAISWFYKYAGKSATDSLWKPLLQIKFGPYFDRVPIAWMIGRLSQRMQSRKSGEERLGYLDGSLNTLLEGILAYLEEAGVELVASTRISSLQIEKGRLVAIKSDSGVTYSDERFLSTLPTVYMVPLLEEAGAKEMAHSLSKIRYFGAVCGILEMKRPLGRHYWLNVAEPSAPFGGIIEHTQFIDPEIYDHKHIAYLSRYFAPDDDISEMDDIEIEELFLNGLKKIYPDFDPGDLLKFHVFRTKTAATVCDLVFSKKVPECRTQLDGLFLANMAHIYPDERSVNNSIRVACEAIRMMGEDASDVPIGRSLSGQIGFGKSQNSPSSGQD